MESVSQRELRNQSGEVLRRVAAGESLIITNHGRPAALLTPFIEDEWAALIASGRVKPAKRTLDLEALGRDSRASTLGVSSSATLDDDRGDR